MPRPACLFFKNHSRVSIFLRVYFACLFLCLKIPIHVYLCLFYKRILYCFACAHVCSCLFLIFVSISSVCLFFMSIFNRLCLFFIEQYLLVSIYVYQCLFMSISWKFTVFRPLPACLFFDYM